MTVVLTTVLVITCLLLYRFIAKKKQSVATTAICSICCEEFLDKELHILADVSVCSKDYIEYTNFEWVEVKNFISDPDSPEKSMQVYYLQKKLIAEKIPAFIKTSYFEKNDILYSSFTLFIKKSDLNKSRHL
jgi:hypothetical protein